MWKVCGKLLTKISVTLTKREKKKRKSKKKILFYIKNCIMNIRYKYQISIWTESLKSVLNKIDKACAAKDRNIVKFLFMLIEGCGNFIVPICSNYWGEKIKFVFI